MSPEASQRVQTVLRDGGECSMCHLADPSARVPGGKLAYDAGYGLGLAGLGELLQVREVHPLATKLYSAQALAPRRLPFATPKVYGGRPHPATPRPAHHNFAGAERYPGREALAHLAGAFRGVVWLVVFHQDHPVRHVQVVAHAADDHDRRDA